MSLSLLSSLICLFQVFIRELISNASDALEKLRYFLLADGKDPGALEIRISTDKQNRILTIEVRGLQPNFTRKFFSPLILSWQAMRKWCLRFNSG